MRFALYGSLISVIAIGTLYALELQTSPWHSLSSEEMRATVGGDDCTWQDYPECDGPPEDCDGEDSDDPSTWTESCTEVKEDVWECHNKNEEQYQNNTKEDDYPKCKSSGKEGTSCSSPESIPCYKIWTCPVLCEWTERYDDEDHLIFAGYRCKAGSDIETGASQDKSEVVGTCPE
jgi:hypothetical protein